MELLWATWSCLTSTLALVEGEKSTVCVCVMASMGFRGLAHLNTGRSRFSHICDHHGHHVPISPALSPWPLYPQHIPCGHRVPPCAGRWPCTTRWPRRPRTSDSLEHIVCRRSPQSTLLSPQQLLRPEPALTEPRAPVWRSPSQQPAQPWVKQVNVVKVSPETTPQKEIPKRTAGFCRPSVSNTRLQGVLALGGHRSLRW